MAELSAAKIQRRQELYGPSRCLVREAAKEKQLEDHVRENFEKGAVRVHSNHTFQTVSGLHFDRKQLPNYHRRQPRHISSIHFGSDKPTKDSVTTVDFPGQPVSEIVPVSVDRTVYLADFAPQYREDDTTGNTFYKTDFDGNKSYAIRQAAKTAEEDNMKESAIKFHTGTHFELGSDKEKSVTETSQTYKGEGDFSNPDYLSHQADDRSKSSVFRPGDYNLHSRTTDRHFMSTTMKDYAEGATSCITLPDGEIGRMTSFVLGYDPKEGKSVYGKDFNPNRLKNTTKAPLAHGPLDSKVMHEYPVFGSTKSVSSQAFVRHPLESGRLDSAKNVKKRHTKVAVQLQHGEESKDHLLSETMMSFSGPGCTEHMKPTIPVYKNYHHLECNRALPENHPLLRKPCTEAQDNFTTPVENEEEYAERKKEGENDRESRRQDNKGTHFTLGYDPLSRQTEHTSEFTDKKPLDPTLPPTGYSAQGYSIITHDSGEYEAPPPCMGRGDTQQLIQQRNYLKNINPRDTVNLNLRKAFLEYDKNLSGAIGRADIKTVCKNMGIDVKESDLDEIITRCDTNGDGLIDYHEFSLNLTRSQPPGAGVLQPGDLTTITRQDFCPPKDQQMTPKQLWVLDKDSKRFEPIETQSSHLMQWAPDADYLKSINRKDFIEPDSIPTA